MSKRTKTPTFLLELPLVADAGQAARVGAHLEVGRQFYNAMLSAGQRRLRRMRSDPAWQAARAIPRTHKQERKAAFSALRERYGFSEYAFHELAKELRVAWLAEHLDAVLAQTLASRAYSALNRVCPQRKDCLQRLAETLWQKRGTACPRDAHRPFETYRCKHGRHPARGPHTHDQTVSILPWLREVCQKAALAALAPVPVRHRAGAARPLLRVSDRLS